MEVNGFINWWEFAPTKDLMLCRVIKDETTEKTETGLILQVQNSVVEDRPSQGVIVSVGPEAPYSVGTFIYWTKTGGYDQHQIRKNDDEYYTLISPETVLGQKVKDTRKK